MTLPHLEPQAGWTSLIGSPMSSLFLIYLAGCPERLISPIGINGHLCLLISGLIRPRVGPALRWESGRSQGVYFPIPSCRAACGRMASSVCKGHSSCQMSSPHSHPLWAPLAAPSPGPRRPRDGDDFLPPSSCMVLLGFPEPFPTDFPVASWVGLLNRIKQHHLFLAWALPDSATLHQGASTPCTASEKPMALMTPDCYASFGKAGRPGSNVSTSRWGEHVPGVRHLDSLV